MSDTISNTGTFAAQSLLKVTNSGLIKVAFKDNKLGVGRERYVFMEVATVPTTSVCHRLCRVGDLLLIYLLI